MRIRVLIVDDEKLERVLIRNGFEWEQNGFEIVGEAQSGAEALDFVRYRKPELVLTDISMPQMDGLELAEKILEEMPECHIIIITGYREFEYARRAVKIGVEDFLLKPINIEELENITGTLKEKILQEKADREQDAEREKNELATRDILRDSFFQRLVERRVAEEEAVPKLELYECGLLCSSCVCVNLKLEDTDGTKGRESLHGQVMDLVREQNYGRTVCFLHYMQNIILYFMQWTVPDVLERIHDLQEIIWNQVGILSDVGVSGENTGYEGISKAFEESEKALGATVYLGKNHCVAYSEYEEVMKKNPGKQDIDWDGFLFAVNNGMENRVKNDVAEYTELVRGSKVPDREYLRLMTMNLLLKAGSTLNRYGISLEQLLGEDELYRQVREIRSVDEMRDYLSGCLDIVLSFHESKKVRKGNKVVEEALAYIQDNLYDPELGLRMVASKIFTNESYLSRVFKKDVGQSLIEYITKKRIEESICLMNTTDLKVYEIAEKIGFRDSHYFSICFKKQTGMTVKEFRK